MEPRKPPNVYVAIVVALFIVVASAQGVSAYRQWRSEQRQGATEQILRVSICDALQAQRQKLTTLPPDVDRWSLEQCLSELERRLAAPGPEGKPGDQACTRCVRGPPGHQGIRAPSSRRV